MPRGKLLWFTIILVTDFHYNSKLRSNTKKMKHDTGIPVSVETSNLLMYHTVARGKERTFRLRSTLLARSMKFVFSSVSYSFTCSARYTVLNTISLSITYYNTNKISHHGFGYVPKISSLPACCAPFRTTRIVQSVVKIYAREVWWTCHNTFLGYG